MTPSRARSRGAAAFALALIVATLPGQAVASGIAPGASRPARFALHIPAGATALGPVPAYRQITLDVVLAPTHSGQLQALLADQRNPASSRYQQYLAPGQFLREFGPSAQQIGGVTAWLRGAGLNDVRVDGLTVEVHAGAAAIARGPRHHDGTIPHDRPPRVVLRPCRAAGAERDRRRHFGDRRLDRHHRRPTPSRQHTAEPRRGRAPECGAPRRRAHAVHGRDDQGGHELLHTRPGRSALRRRRLDHPGTERDRQDRRARRARTAQQCEHEHLQDLLRTAQLRDDGDRRYRRDSRRQRDARSEHRHRRSGHPSPRSRSRLVRRAEQRQRRVRRVPPDRHRRHRPSDLDELGSLRAEHRPLVHDRARDAARAGRGPGSDHGRRVGRQRFGGLLRRRHRVDGALGRHSGQRSERHRRRRHVSPRRRRRGERARVERLPGRAELRAMHHRPRRHGRRRRRWALDALRQTVVAAGCRREHVHDVPPGPRRRRQRRHRRDLPLRRSLPGHRRHEHRRAEDRRDHRRRERRLHDTGRRPRAQAGDARGRERLRDRAQRHHVRQQRSRAVERGCVPGRRAHRSRQRRRHPDRDGLVVPPGRRTQHGERGRRYQRDDHGVRARRRVHQVRERLGHRDRAQRDIGDRHRPPRYGHGRGEGNQRDRNRHPRRELRLSGSHDHHHTPSESDARRR